MRQDRRQVDRDRWTGTHMVDHCVHVCTVQLNTGVNTNLKV